MASSNAASSDLVSSAKEELKPMNSGIDEMDELTAKVFNELRSLELYWKSNIEAQVKIYRNRLEELKNSLNIGGGQLQSEVQDSRTTHQQQQEELIAILKGLEELEYQNKYLSVEMRKVLSELKDRRTNLRKCRVDATPSLSNRLQDASNDKKAVQEQKLCEETAQDMKSEAANAKISSGENDAENSMNESTKSGAEFSLAKL